MKTLNDKLMLTDILAHLRDLMMQSGTAIQHSNCPDMRAIVTTTSGRTTEHQFKVFQYMHNHDMYPVLNFSDEELKKTIDLHCKPCKPK